MDFQSVIESLRQHFDESTILQVNEEAPQPYLVINPEKLFSLCKVLHTHESFYFDFLSCITGVDNGIKEKTMEVIYHLYSIPYDAHLVLKVVIPRNQISEPNPQISSVCSIWHTANWHERETYDLLGIEFIGHPDLRRILLPADWEGHPLRKDYQHQEKYHGIKVAY